MSSSENFTFQTEAAQILELMAHSVYSNREIFLRELISNASDALDKLRFEAIENQALLSDDSELGIHLEVDAAGRTLTVQDNGIGMSREELIENIGTIAKSGTKEFIKKIKAQKEATGLSADLIGQFGVGFYSAFMVADKVELVTRRAGETGAYRWSATGGEGYTIEEAERESQGTTITLTLKPVNEDDGLRDFTSEWVLRDIVKKYSDFVSYPVQLEVEREEAKLNAEGEADEDGGTVKVKKVETLNSMKALWTKSKSEVEDDEYTAFYKQTFHDWNDPLETIAFKAEGTFNYQALLFLPTKAPSTLFHAEHKIGVKLYVKRVFIMEDSKELIPEYLRFLRGVVDAEDLNLNISREILQQDRQVQAIRKRIVKKVLDALKSLRTNDEAKYNSFWREFGTVLKEGIYHDADHRDTLLGLLKAESTSSTDALVSLGEYKDRMKEGQEAIYYMTGSSRAAIESSPHLESFLAKDYEVLFLTDPVDEVWLQMVPEFEDLKLVNVSRGEVSLSDDQEKEKEELDAKTKTFGSLLEKLKETLDEDIKEVRLSSRLTKSAACLVVDQNDISPQMEQLMQAMGQDVPKSKRILEVNPNHPILEKLQAKFDADQADASIGDYAKLLHGQALLAEGGKLDNPAAFSALVSDLMTKALS